MALAASAAAQASRDEDLKALRARIEALKSGLGEKEADRREARDALRDSERAISDANRALRALEAEGRAAQADLARLASRQKALEASLARQQAALGRVLAARYAAGAPDALKVALSGENPSDVARRLYYLAELSRATAQLLREQLFGVSAADPTTLAAVAATLLGVALVATFMPARRAMRVTPARALASE